ncbi:MAG TPA: retropepsin-like aspartic protease [Candidatus Lokiarchaeia archaeon]|nr:retropepsin-like aspartic protease [Candidatus Lokiarchaeia archaeon]
MGTIKKKIKVTGDKGSISVTALFDSGSSKTFIRKDKASTACTITLHDTPVDITLADGKSKIKEIGICALKMVIDDHDVNDAVHVIDADSSAEMYIGVPTLQRFNIGLKFGKTQKQDKIDFSKFTPEVNELF